MKLIPNFPLKEYNTFAIEATAAYHIDLESVADAKLLVRDEYFRTIPFLIMGGGSNLLFVGDFKGAVVHYSGSALEVLREDDEEVILQVGAGHLWHDLVLQTAKQGLWGVENLVLIPGDAGAAAVQNIGAYGREICDVLEAVHTIDLRTGEERRMTTDECDYSYRYSIFKSPEMAPVLVTAIELRLSKTPKPCLTYKGLQGLASETALTPLLIAERVMQIRKSKLPNPKEIPNAGSFFTNPILREEEFKPLQEQHPEVPFYKMEKGYKVPAAWLIERVGYKGYRNEKVGTYELQPLVLINHGGAEANEVVAFAEEIQDKVREQYGIALVPEVRYVRSAEQYSIKELS
ncbi:MAG: UDP-N-acetylmuramate dehydrogenase [Porphyromonas sp.]|nr:UDP-N-acetylmuramate dehydrogenase [Porphyromonas sp.]